MTSQTSQTSQTLPVPVLRDSRTCFGVAWFATEGEAQAYAAMVGSGSYNGGFFHDLPTGRDRALDFTTPQGQALYAVTTP